MNLSDLKPGDKLTTYNNGKLVNGVVTKLTKKGVKVKTEPVQFGNKSFEFVYLTKPTKLEIKYNGHLAVPHSFINGEPITTKP